MDATRRTGEVEHDVCDWIDSLLHRRPVVGDLFDQIEDPSGVRERGSASSGAGVSRHARGARRELRRRAQPLCRPLTTGGP